MACSPHSAVLLTKAWQPSRPSLGTHRAYSLLDKQHHAKDALPASMLAVATQLHAAACMMLYCHCCPSPVVHRESPLCSQCVWSCLQSSSCIQWHAYILAEFAAYRMLGIVALQRLRGVLNVLAQYVCDSNSHRSGNQSPTEGPGQTQSMFAAARRRTVLKVQICLL